MKHFNNKLKIFAVSAITLGYLGSYECARGADAPKTIGSAMASNSCQHAIKCKLEVKLRVTFGGKQDTFNLFDSNRNGVTNSFDFTTEGEQNPVLKMEVVAADPGFAWDQTSDSVKITKLKDGTPCEEAPISFKVHVKGEGINSDMESETPTTASVKLSKTPAQKKYTVSITPKAVTDQTKLGEYASGTLKFSLASE